MWPALDPDTLARLPQEVLHGSPLNLDRNSELRIAEAWKECFDALLATRMLEDDWDGQGSPAPAPELVDSAIILAVLLRQKNVKPPCHTVQCVQGGVNFHWQWPDNVTFEIDVMEPYMADVFLLRPNQPCPYWQFGNGVAVPIIVSADDM